jgi:dihydrofolate synthase/folylpolyglutamate synthase
MNYSQAIEYVLSFPDKERFSQGPQAFSMSVDCMRSLLSRLGNPEKDRKTIHVTGSKGKGSICNYIASILRAIGTNVATFTSPHLNSFCERIAVNRHPISEEDFANALSQIRENIEAEHNNINGPVSTFGILTALFFHVANKQKVDWQVVEVGCGGRDDATNIFDQKKLAIISPISLEHTKILGKTTAEIAANKAGIITNGCTTILAPQNDPSVKPVIARHCLEIGAELIDVDSVYRPHLIESSLLGQLFAISSTRGTQKWHISMLGQHQMVNAVTAFAAIDTLTRQGLKVSQNSMKEGLGSVKFPGRFEIVSEKPTIVLDGAHNDESVKALVKTLKQHFSDRNFILIIGVNDDKDIKGMMRNFADLSPRVIATKSQNIKALDVETIISNGQTYRMESTSSNSVEEALKKAALIATANDVICITGSLYVVGEAREILLSEKALAGKGI